MLPSSHVVKKLDAFQAVIPKRFTPANPLLHDPDQCGKKLPKAWIPLINQRMDAELRRDPSGYRHGQRKYDGLPLSNLPSLFNLLFDPGALFFAD
jgi:hypothetical protein